MERLFFFILIIFNFGIEYLMTDDNQKYMCFKELLRDYYSTYIYRGKQNQEIIIKEFIKKIENVKFAEGFRNAEIIKKIDFKDANLKESYWIFEKLNFIPEYIGNKRISDGLLPAEPKFPRDYYKTKADFITENYKNFLYIKLKPIKDNMAELYDQYFTSYSSNFIFNIEYFLIYDEYIQDKLNIENLKDKNVCFKIMFVQDKSPLSSYEREIKIFGKIEEIE